MFVFTLVGSICIWTVLLLITGTPRRKRIPKSEIVPGSKQLSLFPAFLAVGFAHLLILLIFWSEMRNDFYWGMDGTDELMLWAAGLILCCFFLYYTNNSSNIKSNSGYMLPRTDFVLVSVIYWAFMFFILLFMFDSLNNSDASYDDVEGFEPLIWEMVTWMIFTSICIPLLYAGFTKNPGAISGMGVMGLVASALMFIPLSDLRYEVDDEMAILLIPCIIILSYLVWMSPWPDEKPEWGEV
jgi:hypothetical protein